MTLCQDLLDRLAAAPAGALPAEMEAHLAGCPDCRLAVERARGLAEGELVLRSVRAPEALKRRLKAMPRLAPGCEQAVDLLGLALDGELPEGDRGALVKHLHECRFCTAVWESFATLHDVGSNVRTPGRLRAAIALHPARRIEMRRRKHFFDLRLATAAAYLIAALTVTLLSNPATLARASSERMDEAATYAAAAVQNRFSSYSRRVIDVGAAAEGWVRDQAVRAWERAKSLFGGKPENPKPNADVSKDGGNP